MRGLPANCKPRRKLERSTGQRVEVQLTISMAEHQVRIMPVPVLVPRVVGTVGLQAAVLPVTVVHRQDHLVVTEASQAMVNKIFRLGLRRRVCSVN